MAGRVCELPFTEMLPKGKVRIRFLRFKPTDGGNRVVLIGSNIWLN
jgi:hypothetical protein